MGRNTDVARAESQGQAAAATLLLDDEQTAALRELGFTDEWLAEVGLAVELPENPYMDRRLAAVWEKAFIEAMRDRV
jgi:hypothetical protein